MVQTQAARVTRGEERAVGGKGWVGVGERRGTATACGALSGRGVQWMRAHTESSGAWQSAHRGGGLRTPRAGAARAAHHAAGADTPALCSGAPPRPKRRGAAQPPPR
jgi:hypothetical protein